MNPLVLNTLLSLVGVGVGWLLTQATNFLTVRGNDRRILKETVYFLLEFRHELRSSTAPHLVERIFFQEYLKRVPGATATEEERQKVVAMGKDVARHVSASVGIEDAKKLRENFAACLLKLAAVDPVNAFQLKGKDLVLSYVHEIESQAAEKMVATATAEQMAEAEQLSKAIVPDAVMMMLQTALAELEEVMMELARKIDRSTHRALKKRLALADAKDEETMTKVAEQLLDTVIMPAMHTHYTAQTAAAETAARS